MTRSRTRDERGQLIVIFALALVALVAMVGLVLDGGSTFAQRRSEQNAVDLAALAAANDLIVNQGGADWVGTARSVAKENGYEHGVNGVIVDVTCKNCPGQALDTSAAGVQVTVAITASHRNAFAGVVGMPSWDVSATATSKTGWPDTATGPGPFILSKEAFNEVGQATVCTDPDNPCLFNHPTTAEGDTPQTESEFAWTDFHYDTPCDATGNVNDSELQDYLANSATFETTLGFGCYIAQHNSGQMNNIVAKLGGVTPITFPVPIVDTSGNYVGWASFVLTDTHPNGANGTISGYFETGNRQDQRLDVHGSGFGTSTYGGTYVLKLIN
jgi:Flp pilus assembly protein TadG